MTILNQFQARWEFLDHKIAVIDPTGLPEWALALLSQVTKTDIDNCLYGHCLPLIGKLRYTPSQCLDRVPKISRKCQFFNSCSMWDEKYCTNLNKNVCMLFSSDSLDATEIINLWRDGLNVVYV